MKRRYVLGTLFIIALLIPIASLTRVSSYHHISETSDFTTAQDLSGINVAVFEGTAGDAAAACRTAMVHMFQWMNATVEMVNASAIKAGALWNYDILALPPGNLPAYSVELGTQGFDAIREYIDHGGSYFGLAGGAIFACDRLVYGGDDEHMLKLYNGTARGPIVEHEEQSISTITVNTTCTEIDLSGFPSTMSTLFWGATFFVSDYMTDIIPVAYASGLSNPSMIAYQYGSGCVFLSGLHPEFEEDSDRDGSDLFDDLDDPDSEWPLMLEISQWMVDTTEWVDTTTATTSNPTNTETSTLNDTVPQTDFLQTPASIAVIVAVTVALVALIVARVRKS
ncbi:MAG: BPL-N domain-containing protein [Candidatus Thorarchaeota archaeon]|jgi:glutamine amidotransferase-like uncharacterized protein